MKILRNILFGPTQGKGVWRITYNEKMDKVYDCVALFIIFTPEETTGDWPRSKGL
jgi:hypothetical protein